MVNVSQCARWLARWLGKTVGWLGPNTAGHRTDTDPRWRGAEALEARVLLAANPLTPIDGIGGPDALSIDLQHSDGSPFLIEQVDQPILVMDFWATWCAPCEATLPKLHALRDWAQKNDVPVGVVTINLGEQAAPAESFWQARGFDLPLLMDPAMAAFNAYAGPFNVAGIPFTVVVAGGKIAAHHAGFDPTIDLQLQDDIRELEPLVAPSSEGPEIDVKGNGQSITAGDATPKLADHTHFGNKSTGASRTRTFTIVNSGPGALVLNGEPAVTITGPDAERFTLVSEPAVQIAAGDSSDFKVRFNPLSLRAYEATVRITSNDSDENPYELAIAGAGVPARVGPDAVDFELWQETDFTRHSVDLFEIRWGGAGRDDIPPIDNPVYETVADADTWLEDDWPILLFEHHDDVRAYPLSIIAFHEIVNAVVGGLPMALTICPLCNSTFVFDRTLEDGRVLDFGTTGNLRFANLVMYDRQTESWWQQFGGDAIAGKLSGTQLTILPSQIISWGQFKSQFLSDQVLARPFTFGGYDILHQPRNPDADLERVVAVEIDGLAVGYPFSSLKLVEVVNDRVADRPIAVFWQEGTLSLFTGLEIGASGVFFSQIDGQDLTFRAADDGLFQDVQTRSQWNIFGPAIAGPLAGRQLSKVKFGEHFQFAWFDFKPHTLTWFASDFGDAPDDAGTPRYPTLPAHDGARHRFEPDGPLLGTTLSADPDGLLDPQNPDDDDGVNFEDPLSAGRTVDFAVVVSGAGGNFNG